MGHLDTSQSGYQIQLCRHISLLCCISGWGIVYRIGLVSPWGHRLQKQDCGCPLGNPGFLTTLIQANGTNVSYCHPWVAPLSQSQPLFVIKVRLKSLVTAWKGRRELLFSTHALWSCISAFDVMLLPPLSLQLIVKSGQSTSRYSIIGNRSRNVALAFDATYSPHQNQDNRESKRPHTRQAPGEYNSARKNRAQERMLLEFNHSHTTPQSTRPVC